MAVVMGSFAAGTLLWGKIAQQTNVFTALIYAAIGAIAASTVTRRWRIAGIELAGQMRHEDSTSHSGADSCRMSHP
jgi:hypothetical protein